MAYRPTSWAGYCGKNGLMHNSGYTMSSTSSRLAEFVNSKALATFVSSSGPSAYWAKAIRMGQPLCAVPDVLLGYLGEKQHEVCQQPLRYSCENGYTGVASHERRFNRRVDSTQIFYAEQLVIHCV